MFYRFYFIIIGICTRCSYHRKCIQSNLYFFIVYYCIFITRFTYIYCHSNASSSYAGIRNGINYAYYGLVRHDVSYRKHATHFTNHILYTSCPVVYHINKKNHDRRTKYFHGMERSLYTLFHGNFLNNYKS